jgi:FMN phosphatase YigB (HAD superfamily)
MTKTRRSRPSLKDRPSSRPTGKAGKKKSAARPLITTVIFDLDDTLYDCYGQRVVAAHRHAAEAMVAAGLPADVEDVLKLRLAAFKTDPRLSHIDAEICRRFGVADPERLIRIARQAFFTLPVGELTLFPGSRRVLDALHARGVRLFVVSFGDPDTQRAKAAALGLDRDPAVERLFFADPAGLVTKEGVFRSILRNVEPDPRRVLVVGDRPSSEIRAGNLLGMHTARLRHGEFASLEPVGPEERARFKLRAIEDVLRLPMRFGAA